MKNQNFFTPQSAALLTGAARGDRPVRPPSLRHWHIFPAKLVV